MYLTRFDFPGESAENNYITGFRSTCWDSFYPFGIFPQRELESVTFEPITIFCGGNGSGKTTALNVIAEKLGLHRDSLFDRICRYVQMQLQQFNPLRQLYHNE